jgi:hypothetical protein
VTHHDEAISCAPGLDVPKAEERAAWIEWVEARYPYDPKVERSLKTRMPTKQAEQTRGDLLDFLDQRYGDG